MQEPQINENGEGLSDDQLQEMLSPELMQQVAQEMIQQSVNNLVSYSIQHNEAKSFNVNLKASDGTNEYDFTVQVINKTEESKPRIII
jgi:hypothetical protein